MKRFLGLRLDPVSRSSLFRFVEATCRDGRKTLVTHLNVHSVNLAQSHPDFREVINRSDLVYCDGIGVKLAAQMLGHRVPERMTTPDWLDEFATFLRDRSLRLYFVGNAPEALEAGLRRIRERSPGVQVAGHHGHFPASDLPRVLEDLRAYHPHVLMVGMGMPRQELWIQEHWDRLDANVVMTVGAVLEWYSGRWSRGPRWATDHGAEWVGRMMTQPGHVWKRYLLGNPVFIARVALSLLT